MDDFDHIRIEGDGQSPKGIRTRVFRNGSHIPGLVSFKLKVDASGVNHLITDQIVILEKDEDVVERATQALEEREAAWQRGILPSGRSVGWNGGVEGES